MPGVGVVDHGMGNIRSVAKALEAAGASVTTSSDPRELTRLDALCVPGQGIFGRCVDNLRAAGSDAAIREWIDRGRPYLGICLGMQVLFGSSEERGPVAGLGILEGRVSLLTGPVPVPHIGWNLVGASPGSGEHFYFDHSYVIRPDDDGIVSGWTEHGEIFAAQIASGSILGVQFHPEKSGAAGIELLKGWVSSL